MENFLAIFKQKMELENGHFSFSQCLFSYIFSPRRIPRERWPGSFSPSFRLWIPKTVQTSALYRSRRELSNAEYKEGKRSAQREVTPELFLSCGGELRDVEEEFSEYVRYCYGYLSKFSFFSLSPCPFSQSSFRTDSYSNEYSILFICKIWLRYSRKRAPTSLRYK